MGGLIWEVALELDFEIQVELLDSHGGGEWTFLVKEAA